MPERSKRRKNNKNKRKNKSQRVEVKINDSDVQDIMKLESCSAETSNITKNELSPQQEFENGSEKVNTVSPVPSSSNQVTDIENTPQDQDLNNNSDNVELFSVSVSNSMDDLNAQHCPDYVVESPEKPVKSKPRLDTAIKSKSLDNDDAPQIVEITDSCDHIEDSNDVAVVNSSHVLIYEVDSDVEWEKINELKSETLPVPNELATGTLSITTIPLNVASCEQTKSITSDEEMSLRNYLHTLNLSTHPNANTVEIKTEIEQIINREINHRLRKKGLADDFTSQRPVLPRILDVIDEEGSSESSMTSRRQSYLSDKKSDTEDLEDDVFEDKTKPICKYSAKTVRQKHYGKLVPQQCMLVGAKIKEPEVTEARCDWSLQTMEKMTGAEVVYLTDSSSSTSSIHDIGDETDDSVETDVSVRMITPTIEVTDTEDLLKKTFVSSKSDSPKNEKTNESTVLKTNDVDLEIQKINVKHDNNVLNLGPDQSSHEIVILSTNNIKTNLYVKDLEETDAIKECDETSRVLKDEEMKTKSDNINNNKNINSQNENDNYKLELKVLKCELNDAINNLIKEVSDTEVANESSKENFARQDSSSSVCSSQCTAKYNPTYSSLNDISNILHDDQSENTAVVTDNIDTSNEKTYVKEVFECVTGTTTKNNKQVNNSIEQPLTLRDSCVNKIATFPYGHKILEELASVSERLQNINIYGLNSKGAAETTTAEKKTENMPCFPLPDISSIEKISLSSKSKESPPPVLPRNSSLKKSHDENHWTALPSKQEPVYVCLSPSQKMLMEKTNTKITKEDASELIDIHKKYVDRRGYNEYMEKGNEHYPDSDPPVVPFKSQTGSRLLALIRDPSVTYNINSNINDHYNKNLQQAQKYTYKKSVPNKSYENIKTRDFSNIFRPIPPPRPKKYSSSFYESDESSDFTDNSFRSMKSEKKFFHFSTGNLNKEIENDVSSIQNMHRHFTNVRDKMSDFNFPRRPSLPKDICDQQMEYIRQKEKEVEAEIKRLEEERHNVPLVPKRGPKAPLIKEKEETENKFTEGISNKSYTAFSTNNEKISNGRLHSLFSSSQEELLRDKMYSEYVNQMAERQERKQHRIIKVTDTGSRSNAKTVSKSMSSLDFLDSKVNNRIEKEFISKARERWNKLGIQDPETEDEKDNGKDVYREPKIIEHKIKVIEGDKETDVKNLPSHLQDFVRFTAKDRDEEKGSTGESGSRPASPHVVILCAVIILVLAIGKYFMRLLRNKC